MNSKFWFSLLLTLVLGSALTVIYVKHESRVLFADLRDVQKQQDRQVIEWGRLQWPDNPPRSIGRLAVGVSAPLSTELRRLSGASYGPNEDDWNGAALAKALRSFAVVDERADSPATNLLPPLMPET